MADHARVAMVAGATGLVGREILAVLLADKSVTAVHCVGRKAPPLRHPKLVAHAVDLQQLPPLPAVDDVYIALGTTIKVAGSRAAFRAIDYDAVLAVATAARAQGATRLGVVSAMGADPRSAVFYSRVKGEMEAAVQQLGYARVVLARPSMLDGARDQLDQPARPLERLSLPLMRALQSVIPANYRAIPARDVAASLVAALQAAPSGQQCLLSGQLLRH